MDEAAFHACRVHMRLEVPLKIRTSTFSQIKQKLSGKMFPRQVRKLYHRFRPNLASLTYSLMYLIFVIESVRTGVAEMACLAECVEEPSTRCGCSNPFCDIDM